MFVFPSLVVLFTFFTLLPSFVTLSVSAAHAHRNIAKTRRALNLDRGDVLTFLDAHNSVRARHGAQPLAWSRDLAEKAGSWADLCIFEHSNGILNDRPYGESIVAATGRFTIRDAVGTWAKSKDQYDPRTTYSQFTQMVWKSTTQVGCAISRCADIVDRPVTLYVCVYDPAGNVIGELADNVQV